MQTINVNYSTSMKIERKMCVKIYAFYHGARKISLKIFCEKIFISEFICVHMDNELVGS